MELGGNAPFIVFDDADVEAAVRGAIASKYRNAGQTCVCANRFLVQSGIHDAFVKRLSEVVSGLSVGDGFGAGVHVGPLIDEKAVAKVEELVLDAVSCGGRIVTGGTRRSLGHSFYRPTVIADASPDSKIFAEEIFGPVALIFRFETEEEAIRLANDTQIWPRRVLFWTRYFARLARCGGARIWHRWHQ